MTEILWNKVNVNYNDAVCYDENTERRKLCLMHQRKKFQIGYFSYFDLICLLGRREDRKGEGLVPKVTV